MIVSGFVVAGWSFFCPAHAQTSASSEQPARDGGAPARVVRLEVDAPIVPKPGQSLTLRVSFDRPMDKASRPSAEVLLSGPPQVLREGAWNQDATGWSFTTVKLGPSRGLGRLAIRGAKGADGSALKPYEEPFLAGRETLLGRLREVAAWMTAHPHDYIFVEGYNNRTILALYEITGEKRYLDEARRGAEKLLARQAPGGFWDTGYGRVYLADTGSALGLLLNFYKFATAEERRRIDTSLDRYLDLVLVKGDSTGRSFVHADGSLGVGFKSYKEGKAEGDLNKPYIISTALTGAEVFAALHYLRGNETHRKVAVKACDWVFGTMGPRGDFPYVFEDTNPGGKKEADYWKTYAYTTSAYVGEGLIQAWTYLDDAAFRRSIETRIAPHIQWLLDTQSADGSWGVTDTFDDYRSHGVVNLLIWYHDHVRPDPRVARAVRRYYLLLLDDGRISYRTVAPKELRKRANPISVPVEFIATCLAGRALAEVVQPDVDCYRWKKE